MQNQVNDDDSQWIAYVGPFAFPEGGAAARRILGNAQSVVQAGYRVVVASGQTAGDMQSSDYTTGIRVVSLGERTAEHWPRALRRLRYAGMGRSTQAWLAEQATLPSAVILYSGYTPYLLRLIPWCRRMKIPLIFDAVEWYEAPGMFGPILSPYQWNIELAMRWLVKRVDGVITISNYLTRYYRESGQPVLRIPPTLSIADIPARNHARVDTYLHLCYAGSPGANKDLIDNVIAALLSIDEDGEQFRLHVAGLTRRELLSLPSLAGRSNQLPFCIEPHGQLSHSAAMSLVQSCDYTVLLRKETRVSRAGFPTKLVESLALGVPVIGNITGDLAEFLIDRKTGLVCDDWSVDEFRLTLLKALEISHSDLQGMRSRCRDLAALSFDINAHSEAMRSFIESVSH